MKAFSLCTIVCFVGFLWPVIGKSCDVCGCSVGGLNFGILPQFHKNFVASQYYYREFRTAHIGDINNGHSFSYEKYHTIDFRAKIHLSNRLQLFAIIPYSVNYQIENTNKSTIKGIGDITGLLHYTLYDNGDTLAKKWKQSIQLGGGIKCATGDYKKLDKNEILNPNLQTGTGSYDFLIDVIYTIRYKKLGLNTTCYYKMNTSNKNQYKFGNRLTIESSLFYWANIHGYSLLPRIGITLESARQDSHNNFIIEESGGTTILTQCGLDFYIHDFTIGMNGAIPVFHDNALSQNKYRLGTTLRYNF